jgi:hypothetical protein
MNEIQPPPQRTRPHGCLLAALIVLIVLFAGLLIALLVAPAAIRSVFAPDPTPTPVPPVVTILGLTQIAELATLDVRSVAEIREERTPADLRRYLGGRESLLMLVYGEVKVGFDLSKIEEGDLWSDGKRVQLRLPPPEILAATIDFDRTHIVDYERSFFVGNDPNLQAAVLERATQSLQQAAIDEGALETAKQFGRLFFENHLRSLGFQEVLILTD